MGGDTSRDVPTKAALGGWDRLVGGLVALFALGGDALFASVAIGFTVWQGWLIGFGTGASVAAGLNLAACGWLLPRWDQWVAAQGAKFERRLASLRRNRLLKYPTRWLAQGSTVMFAIACALIGAVTGVALARLASAQPLSRRRVLAACLARQLCTRRSGWASSRRWTQSDARVMGSPTSRA
jgi:hypothetical protein